MTFPAHIRKNEDGSMTVQTVKEHCRAVAELASQNLQTIGLGNCGYLAGLLHDMGKLTGNFSSYLTDAVNGLPVHRGSVIHTFQAARFLLERYHDVCSTTAEILATVVGSHHGWFDCLDLDGNSGFDHRMKDQGTNYDEAKNNFLEQCASIEEIDKLFNEAKSEVEAVVKKLEASLQATPDNLYDIQGFFYIGQLVRLILSAVIDGDRSNTAEFEHGDISANRNTEPLGDIWKRNLDTVESKINTLDASTPINRARATISGICRCTAEQPGGVFRLNAPTGSGKTLSSLRFALAHAYYNNKTCIIFTSPLLSILDQNAQVIRDYIEDQSLILEHHSNVVRRTDIDESDADEYETLTQNWDAPIIITTLVQLLNTLFAGKTSCVRRYHALCNSVIVIDEVQTVPPKMLSMFSLAVNFLSEVCGATIVLCSATQPCLEATEHPLVGVIKDILPYDEQLWNVFARTVIKPTDAKTTEEIVSTAEQIIRSANSLLIICNKKNEAEEIYRGLADVDGCRVFYLSAALCMAHRRSVIREIKDSLAKEKTICVSTQVIEAGVDISFEQVIRLAAGMDSIVQAAGRCNRNGEKDGLSPVYVTELAEENLSRLHEIQNGKNATIALIAEYKKDPAAFGNALISDDSIAYYFKTLYRNMSNGYRDYTTKIAGRNCRLLSLMSTNTEAGSCGEGWYMRQAFKTAGDVFTVFDADTMDVICTYGEGRFIAEELLSSRAINDFDYAKDLIDRAKPYTISLYSYQYSELQAEGSIIKTAHGAHLLFGYYDDSIGFSTDVRNNHFLEV